MTQWCKPPAFWYAAQQPPWASLLAPLGRVYGFFARHRFGLYHPVPMARPVVCIGNLVAGGAGKTPAVMALTRLLLAAGHNPHILTRGYGGREAGPLQVSPTRDTAADVGDESLLLVTAAPTWVSANRARGVQEAIDTGADLVVMDDGFQNAALFKDFSMIVIDGGAGFGNAHVLPAGPLRENIAFGLSRAQAVTIIGDDTTSAEETVRRHAQVPVFTAKLVPEEKDAAAVSGKKFFAFAGIGRPEKFRESLQAAGAEVADWRAFPDHYPYRETDLADFCAAAKAAGAEVITTAKDHVRLPATLKNTIKIFKVNLVWDDPAALLTLISRAIPLPAKK